MKSRRRVLGFLAALIVAGSSGVSVTGPDDEVDEGVDVKDIDGLANPLDEHVDGNAYDIENVRQLDVERVQSSDEPFFNVKAYGAEGDGSTDDTQAFEDALDAAGDVGGTVFVPAVDHDDGEYYRLDGTPTDSDGSWTGATLAGAGYGAFIRQSDGHDGNGIATDGTDDFTVRTLRFENADGEGFDFTDGARITVEHSWVGNNGQNSDIGDGLDFDDCVDCVVTGVFTYENGGGGVHVSSGSEGCTVSQCVSYQDSRSAQDMYNAKNCSIGQCLSIECGGNYAFQSINDGDVDRELSGNSFSQCVAIDADSYAWRVRDASGLTITDCHAINSGNASFYVDDESADNLDELKPVTITNCTAHNPGDNGFDIDAPATLSSVHVTDPPSNEVAIKSSPSLPGDHGALQSVDGAIIEGATHHAVWINDCPDLSLTNIRIRDGSDRAISISTSPRATITDVRVENCSDRGLSLRQCPDSYINNAVITNPGDSGILIDSSGGTRVENVTIRDASDDAIDIDGELTDEPVTVSGTTVERTAGAGVDIAAPTRLDDITIEGASSAAISGGDLRAARDIRVYDGDSHAVYIAGNHSGDECLIDGVYATTVGSRAVYARGIDDISISRVRAYGTVSAAIEVQNCLNATIADVVADPAPRRGIVIEGSPGTSVSDATIFDASVDGIDIDGDAFDTPVSITGAVIVGSGSSAIYTEAPATISNTNVAGAGSAGIYFDGDGGGGSVTGGKVANTDSHAIYSGGSAGLIQVNGVNFTTIDGSDVDGTYTLHNGYGEEPAGSGNMPTAADWPEGATVMNTDDGVVWLRAGSTGWVEIGEAE